MNTSYRMKLLFPILLLGVFSWLAGCQIGGVKYEDIGYDGHSGRTPEQITKDRQEGNYDKNSAVVEVIAHDICDCLSGIDWERMMLAVDSVEVATAKGERGVINDYDTGREVEMMQRCLLMLVPQRTMEYEGFNGTEEEIQVLQEAFKRKCPSIYMAVDRKVIRSWFKKKFY